MGPTHRTDLPTGTSRNTIRPRLLHVFLFSATQYNSVTFITANYLLLLFTQSVFVLGWSLNGASSLHLSLLYILFSFFYLLTKYVKSEKYYFDWLTKLRWLSMW